MRDFETSLLLSFIFSKVGGRDGRKGRLFRGRHIEILRAQPQLIL